LQIHPQQDGVHFLLSFHLFHLYGLQPRRIYNVFHALLTQLAVLTSPPPSLTISSTLTLKGVFIVVAPCYVTHYRWHLLYSWQHSITSSRWSCRLGIHVSARVPSSRPFLVTIIVSCI
jgi:hypothetical protein